MNFKNFIQRKDELTALFRANPESNVLLGFSMDVPAQVLQGLLRKGWWHLLLFASNERRGVAYGLRIMPDKPMKDWPVMAVYQNETAVTFCSSLEQWLYVITVSRFLESKRLFKKFNEDESPYYQKMKTIGQYFNWDNAIEKVKTFVSDSENMPKRDKQWKSELWATLMDSTDDSGLYFKLKSLQKNMIDNANLVPDVETDDFGIWETWGANTVAARAVIKSSDEDQKMIEQKLWNGFIQPTGYDACDLFFSHMPNRIYDPYMGAYEVANILGASYFNCSDEIKTDPLFSAVTSILSLGKGGYLGLDHLNAGETFIGMQGKKIISWNAFVGTAYWSGKNTSETSIEAWQSSINLCKNENWTDAELALKYQYDIYQSLKS